MSHWTDPPWTDPPRHEPPPENVGCVTALLIGIGILMLLPGFCAGFFAVTASLSPRNPYLSGLGTLWIICFAVAAGGIALIWWAVRRPR